MNKENPTTNLHHIYKNTPQELGFFVGMNKRQKFTQKLVCIQMVMNI